jgi:hypothetical protein
MSGPSSTQARTGNFEKFLGAVPKEALNPLSKDVDLNDISELRRYGIRAKNIILDLEADALEHKWIKAVSKIVKEKAELAFAETQLLRTENEDLHRTNEKLRLELDRMGDSLAELIKQGRELVGDTPDNEHHPENDASRGQIRDGKRRQQNGEASSAQDLPPNNTHQQGHQLPSSSSSRFLEPFLTRPKHCQAPTEARTRPRTEAMEDSDDDLPLVELIKKRKATAQSSIKDHFSTINPHAYPYPGTSSGSAQKKDGKKPKRAKTRY